MVFGWKKNTGAGKQKRANTRASVLPLLHPNRPREGGGLIRFENVTLPPAIQDLSLEIPLGSWIVLYGEDDFAKALFCDLCFSYILPESGRVHPVLKGSDVSFLGRSNTTYGKSLLDHLSCGVRETAKELIEFVGKNVLSSRFHRHLSRHILEFAGGKKAEDLELDERDFLEVAEANLLLQNRRAAVIDTTSDFYQIALEQGFRHSPAFLHAGKTLVWIVDEKHRLPGGATPWLAPKFAAVNAISLSFPIGSRAGYLN